MRTLGILIVALVLGQQPTPASIEGVVVRAGTSEPITRAIVQLSGNGLAAPLGMMTGTDGRFEFPNIAPGQYQLTVSRNGYLDSAYGKRGPNGNGLPLVMDAGQARRDIQLQMTAYGAISGRVLDVNGEPIANVPVAALKYSHRDGQWVLTTVKTDQTDDRGEYRLFWLPPGQYYIRATPLGARSGDMHFMMSSPDGQIAAKVIRLNDGMPLGLNLEVTASPVQKLGEADVPVYYPGTPEVRTATRVEVRSAADVGGVDFALQRLKAWKVRGTIIDIITGQPARSATVALVPRSPSLAGTVIGRLLSDGTFEVQGVLPGSYDLVATYRLDVGGDAFRIMGGRMPVEVGGSDVDRVAMVVSPTVDIVGEVTTEGVNDGNSDHHPIVSLKEDLGGTPGRPANPFAQFTTNDRFVINDLIEGNYQVQVSGLPPGTYVKSIRYGAADALNGSVNVDQRSSERISIVLSPNAGALDGTVVNERREPVANVPVALVPDTARRERADLYRSAKTDVYGRFNLQGIPPGDYSVFAWDDIDEGVWRDPEFIRSNEAAGKTIHITEGSRDSIELTVIPSPF